MKYTLKEVAALRLKPMAEARLTEIWYGTYLIRRISLYFTWISINLGLSANTVTILSYLVGIASAISFGVGGSTATLWGVILLHLAFVVDNVDGEVARVTGTGSLTGAYLDTLGHIIVNGAVLFGLAYGQFVTYGTEWIIVVGFVAAFCHVPISRYSIDHEILGRLRKEAATPRMDRRTDRASVPPASSPQAVESTFRVVQMLKYIGFPFNSTPFNILLITAVCGFDRLAEIGWMAPLPVPGVSLMLIYFSVVLLFQQAGSLVRNSRGLAVDVELRSILDRLR